MIKTWEDCVIQAKHRAKQIGVAYAVKWKLGHYTVEDRKPSLRGSCEKVIECWDNGSELLA